MLTKIQNYKTQIEANSAKIAELQEQNKNLMAELAAYVQNNPQEIINLLLNNSSEIAPSQPKCELRTIVSVKFNSNNNKIYDYVYASEEPVKEGDFVIVNTPYSGETKVEVVKVSQKDISNASFTYKEATLYVEPQDWYVETHCWDFECGSIEVEHGPFTEEEAWEFARLRESSTFHCYFFKKGQRKLGYDEFYNTVIAGLSF